MGVHGFVSIYRFVCLGSTIQRNGHWLWPLANRREHCHRIAAVKVKQCGL